MVKLNRATPFRDIVRRRYRSTMLTAPVSKAMKAAITKVEINQHCVLWKLTQASTKEPLVRIGLFARRARINVMMMYVAMKSVIRIWLPYDMKTYSLMYR